MKVATPSAKQNIIKSGDFSPYETPDEQLNGLKGYLDHRCWWYEFK
ncbi:N-acetylmuramoyl-L-alanine amidase C-terminal domain-containing protein [Bacillus thuringiensis]